MLQLKYTLYFPLLILKQLKINIHINYLALLAVVIPLHVHLLKVRHIALEVSAVVTVRNLSHPVSRHLVHREAQSGSPV